MSGLSECPKCGRTCTETVSSNWFPVYTCLECRARYCEDCAGADGDCPECGSSDYSALDKVYA